MVCCNNELTRFSPLFLSLLLPQWPELRHTLQSPLPTAQSMSLAVLLASQRCWKLVSVQDHIL